MLHDYDPDELDVKIIELLVATGEQADPLVDPKVQQALRLLRERLKMDVVFVSQFVDGRRTFRVVDSDPHKETVIRAGESDPVEQTWCQRVVDGRLPQLVHDMRPRVESGEVPDPGVQIGTHLSTPVVLRDGTVYGTLCCFSEQVHSGANELDLKRLQFTAKLLATDLDNTRRGRELSLEPIEPAGFKGKL